MNKTVAPAVDLVALFGSLDDPRALDGRRHRLSDILVIAFCTLLCGQEEFTAMARFGSEKEHWLRSFLELPFGIPSHDTFRAVLSAPDNLAARRELALNAARTDKSVKDAVKGKLYCPPSAMTSASPPTTKFWRVGPEGRSGPFRYSSFRSTTPIPSKSILHVKR